MTKIDLIHFITESNAIEGILREPLAAEIQAHELFLALPQIEVKDLKRFVSAVQPDAILRDSPDLNVRVGKHVAPRGGPSVEHELRSILALAHADSNPYKVHLNYETLHPFTDGNGRSGRALFAWMLLKRGKGDQLKRLGFLHLWYYLSLEHHDAR